MLSGITRATLRTCAVRSVGSVCWDAAPKELLDTISASPSLYNGDFLRTWDHSNDTLDGLVATANLLRRIYLSGQQPKLFDCGLGVSLFRDNSTRTSFSYDSAVSLLGLSAKELDESKSQIAHGETIRETATMISFLTQAIGIRDDKFIHEGHAFQKEVSDALQGSYEEGLLPQRPAVINLQCDQDHPTQSTADLCHLTEQFGSMENLRGKKIAMTWAYSPSYGKPLSVAQGISTLMSRFGMEVVLAHPEGYDLLPETLDICKKHASECGGSFTVTNSMDEAFADADIVYPKSWAPFKVMEERVDLLRGKRHDELHALEQRCLAHNAQHMDWECNEEKMKYTKNGDALYMHCLPADITGLSCEKGEVTNEVFEKYRVRTYKEASHKPFTIAAMILMCRSQDPAAFLSQFF